MLDRSTDTRLFYSLKYYGAAITGRWSGGDGLNLQNLNSKDTEGGIDLRGLIHAGEGRRFVISDLSQIEPRVLAVICGDTAMLDKIREGFGIYEAHARATMGWTGGPLKKEDARLYALAKARCLGLSYGAGAETFVRVAKTMAGLDLTLAEAEQTVSDFRQTNPRIEGLWKRADKRFRQAAGNHCCTMPLRSGRSLRYYSPTIDGNAAQIVGGKVTRWWGSKLVENLIQATARDVLAGMILEIEAAGIPVVLTVHDEIVCEVDERDAFQALDTVRSIMSKPPEWMPDLPVECEAKVEGRYGK
jgi:DNA polymerase